MRIVLVVHQFFPEHFYGTEVLTLNYAKHLKTTGHDVLLVSGCPWRRTQTSDAAIDSYVFEGIEVRRFIRAGKVTDAQSRISRQWSARELDAAFSVLLREFIPDVIHFFHLQNLSVSLLDLASLHAPTFFTATDFWLVCPLTLMRMPDGSACAGPLQDHSNCVKHYAGLSPGAVGKLARAVPTPAFSAALRVARVASAINLARVREAQSLQGRSALIANSVARLARIFAPTEYLAQALRNGGVPRTKVVCMMYGIDMDSQVSPMPAISEGSTVRFGFIGSMSEHKGAHILVSAFRRLAPTLAARLTVFGASPETAYTRRLRLLAGDDPRIAFRPTFPPAQIGAALDEIDCLVIPSLWPENAPLVALSAQAAGRAILASDVPGLYEAAPAADVFREGDVDDLARSLQRLVERPVLLRQQLGRTRRPKSIAQMTTEILESYLETLPNGSV